MVVDIWKVTQSAATSSLTAIAVPKTRRPKFDVELKIIDLNNVPLVSGHSFVKWHLPHSTAAEHRGRTEKCVIKDHKVSYDYTKHIPVRLTIDKNGTLHESLIHLEIVQEYSSGARSERITLGHVRLNLAEYVEPSESDGADGEGVCRRYLMQESKINSTLKISIFMKQIEGDRNYVAPPLKTAPVFGGIAGIMAGEQGEPGDDNGHMPSLSSKSRETGELQDLYRRTLAAHWAAQPGELQADEAIEDIFAGGDGWGDRHHHTQKHSFFVSGSLASSRTMRQGAGDSSTSLSEDGEGRMSSSLHREREKGSQVNLRSGAGSRHSSYRHKNEGSSGESTGRDAVSGRGSLEQQAKEMKAEADRRRRKPSNEVDEFEAREDLRSWNIPGAPLRS